MAHIASHRTTFLENAQRLIAAVGDPVPAWTPTVQEQADHALIGEIRKASDGTWAKFDLDKPIDWSCDQTYNPAQVQMYLLRFHVLGPLAATYRETRDERYAQCARRFIEAFLRDHPITDPWQPARYDGATQYDLRIGAIHSAGWMGTLHVFLESEAFDDALFETIIEAVRIKLNYLSEHIYPDRNIRVLHGDVLLANSLRLSFFEEAARWRELGLRVIHDAVRRQILPDGAHMEAVPGYHQGVLREMTALWRLSRGVPELGLNVPTERIAAMHDYSVATTRPDGALISLHDTRYAECTDELDFSMHTARSAFRKEAGLDDALPAPVQHYPDAGQVYLRDQWDASATYMTFDATTRRSFHWHPSRNAVTLYGGGRPLLVDTGYPFSTDEFPSYGTRTAHHSTVNFNGWDQSHVRAQVCLRRAPGYELVQGHYGGGYWPKENESHGPGMFGEHDRTLLWIRDRCVIVIDYIANTAEADRKPDIESVWQFAEGKVHLDVSTARAYTGHADANLLMLFPVMLDGSTMSVHEGEREPMRGWVPIEHGRRYAPAPMLRVMAAAHDPWVGSMATVLVPFEGENPPAVQAQGSAPSIEFGGRGAGELELHWPDGSRDKVVWIRRLENAINAQRGLDTDASLVHLQYDRDGALRAGLAVDGHYLEAADLGEGDQLSRVRTC